MATATRDSFEEKEVVTEYYVKNETVTSEKVQDFMDDGDEKKDYDIEQKDHEEEEEDSPIEEVRAVVLK
jgi:hypothetical protein